tara:strand:- start:95 stop:739 length:645 start_codon:yes stop_codon:yes gene_type:complete
MGDFSAELDNMQYKAKHAHKASHEPIKKGIPEKKDLKEGVPSIRDIKGELITFVLYNNTIYKNSFAKSEAKIQKAVTSRPAKSSSRMKAMANFDSGWITAVKNKKYEIAHGMGSEFYTVEVFFKDSSDRIFSISSSTAVIHDNDEGTGNYDQGVTLWFKDVDTLVLATSNDHIFVHDNAIGEYQQQKDTGFLRVFMWKIAAQRPAASTFTGATP